MLDGIFNMFTDDPNQYGEPRQTRSNSFGSSLRKLFTTKSDKNLAGGGSREGSLNRKLPQQEIVRDGSYGLQVYTIHRFLYIPNTQVPDILIITSVFIVWSC